MPSQTIGEQRSGALYRIVGGIVYVGLLSWTTLPLAGIIAFIYAALDIIKSALLNSRLETGSDLTYGLLYWHYEILLWVLGFEEFPGYVPTATSA